MIKFDLDKYDYTKNYAIEASAGTGKTYSIVHMVEKLVNDHNVDLSQILIVTFTEKAAGELRNRIREVVKNGSVDNAPIFTIHSFCQSTLREFGISAKQPLALNLVGENDLKKFVGKYVREGKIIQLISKAYTAADPVDPNVVANFLIEAINKYYLDSSLDEVKEIVTLGINPKEIEETINSIIKINSCYTLDQMCNTFPDFKKNYDVLNKSSDAKVQDLIKQIKENYNKLHVFAYTDGNSGYGILKAWPTVQSERDALAFLKDFKDKIKKFPPLSKAIPMLFIGDVYIKWLEYKVVNKAQDYGDMIRMIRESILNDDTLKSQLKKKYRYAIVDEFQDTNRSQFDIFSNIFMSDDPSVTKEKEKHHIIVVGDPKQSIYGFQGADVQVYYDAVKLIENSGGIVCTISKNYRSTKDMVESCNKLFSYYAFAGTTFTPSGYLGDTAGDEIKDVKYCGKPIESFWIASDEELHDYYPQDYAALIAEKIVDCCSEYKPGVTKLQISDNGKEYRNVSFKDFAVLARTRTEMPDIVKALKMADIPFVKYKDNGLFRGKETAHWIALLEAIDADDFTGSKRKIFKKALFTAFFGLSMEQINSDRFQKDDNAENALFNKWKEIASQRRWQDLIDDILINSSLITNTSMLGDITSLSIYNQIGEYCVSFLSKGKNISSLIIQLKNISNGAVSDEDSEDGGIVARGTNFDCVQVMTIHSSKGLQFPIVISIAGIIGANTKGKVFSIHDKNNPSNRVLAFEHSAVKDEEVAEWKRLFYVAYTRAKHILMLPYYKKCGVAFSKETLRQYITDAVESNHIHFIEHDPSVTILSLRAEVAKILLRLRGGAAPVSQAQFDAQISVLKSIIKSEGKKSSFKHSYSSLSHGTTDTNIEVEDGEVVTAPEEVAEGLSKYDKLGKQIPTAVDPNQNPFKAPDSFPRGATIGTILHEVFEKSDFRNYNKNLEELIKECFKHEGMNAKPEWISYIKNMVDNVLNAKLPGIAASKEADSFSLSDIPTCDKKAESEFVFNLLDQRLHNYCNGFIDLLFRHNGRYAVVDWKSDSLSDEFTSYANNAELKKHVDEHYSIQRTLYSYCVIKWLQSIYKTKEEDIGKDIFDKYFGGVYYVFIRGCNKGTGNGIYAQTWNSWDELKKSFNEIIKEKLY